MKLLSTGYISDRHSGGHPRTAQAGLITRIQAEVARACNISRAEMLSRNRSKRVVQARQMAMYLCRDLAEGRDHGRSGTWASFPRIGRAFLRDHSSVMHACRTVAQRCAADREVALRLEELVRELRVRPGGEATTCQEIR